MLGKTKVERFGHVGVFPLHFSVVLYTTAAAVENAAAENPEIDLTSAVKDQDMSVLGAGLSARYDIFINPQRFTVVFKKDGKEVCVDQFTVLVSGAGMRSMVDYFYGLFDDSSGRRVRVDENYFPDEKEGKSSIIIYSLYKEYAADAEYYLVLPYMIPMPKPQG